MMDGAFGFAITALFLAAATAAIVTRSWLVLATLLSGTFYIVVIARNGVQLGLRYFYPGLPLLTVGLVALFRNNVLPRKLCVGIVVALIGINLCYYDRAYQPFSLFRWDWLLSSKRWHITSNNNMSERGLHAYLPVRLLNSACQR